ncbi:hypothetical protein NDU88_002623 [Pleurodeles waltl]|uniref:Uncharacterized protein n=1 Tax=Pleurodeles waltl TaxID=8319 RepID=A0AAV7P9X5_PLEWA|nr:hypothetical protein NDU88_002623 [Pleurodeles waltl]
MVAVGTLETWPAISPAIKGFKHLRFVTGRSKPALSAERTPVMNEPGPARFSRLLVRSKGAKEEERTSICSALGTSLELAREVAINAIEGF